MSSVGWHWQPGNIIVAAWHQACLTDTPACYLQDDLSFPHAEKSKLSIQLGSVLQVVLL